MEAVTKGAIDWDAVADAFAVIEREIGSIDLRFTPQNAERIAALVDELVARTTGDAPDSLHRLLDLVSDWLSMCEESLMEIKSLDPIELLQHLMEANNLRQRDLAPIFGGQSVVSAVLSGRRQINARQAISLGEQFNLSPAAFLAVKKADESEVALYGIDLSDALEKVSLDEPRLTQHIEWSELHFSGSSAETFAEQ
jgi:HTH-type transcriptional regulator/antitoxin HigA